MVALWIVLAVVVVLAVAVVVSYNRFVKQRNLVHESWKQIDVELKRRYELIPNLVETVKGYAAHERQAFDSVTQARAQAVAADTVADQGKAESALSGSLRGLLAVAEAYPQLQAAGPFRDLQAQLAETEDRIAAGRRFYNGNVRAINTRVEAFPSSITASVFHFSKEDYFEVDEAEKGPVDVSFT